MSATTVALILAWAGVAADVGQWGLIVNGGFEQATGRGPAGWQIPPAALRAGAAGVVPGGNGKCLCLKIRQRPRVVAVSKAAAVTGPRWLELTWLCKTEAVAGTASVQVRLDRRPVRVDGAGQGASTEWIRHSHFLYVPEGQHQVSVALQVTDGGTAWFDDVALRPTKPPSAQAPGLESCFHLAGKQGGAKVAWVYPAVKIYPGDPWPSAAAAKEASISLARNEYEALELVIAAEKAMAVEDVMAEGLEGLQFEWRRVMTVDVEPAVVHDIDGRPGPNPDPLYPPRSFKLKAGEQVVLWLRFYAPANAEPGERRGKVVVEGSERIVLPVRVRVWDFALPERPTIVGLGNSRIRAMGEKWRGVDLEPLVGELAENMKRHRVEPWDLATAPLLSGEWVKLGADGTVQIDFATFDGAIEAYRAKGFRRFVMWPRNFRARGPQGARMRQWLGLTPLTPPFERAFADYLRQMARHLRQRGWIDDAIWYPWDEPSPREYEQFKRMLELIKGADRGLRTSVAGALMPLPEFYGLVDMWTTNLRWYEANALAGRVRERLAAGDDVGAYGNNRYLLEFPLSWPRTWGWLLYRYGFKHCGWWSVALWLGDPWTGAGVAEARGRRHYAGEGMWVYPPPFEGAGICDSMRWEALRDGMEDAEYLKLLEERVGHKRAEEIAARIVGGSFPWEYQRDMGKIQAAREEIAGMIEQAGGGR